MFAYDEWNESQWAHRPDEKTPKRKLMIPDFGKKQQKL
jgi:hypothetical protein